MKSHEEKSTCAGSWTAHEGDQENPHARTAGGEGQTAGGSAKEKVAGKRGGVYKYPPFKGGEVFTRLTVVRFSHHKNNQQYWHCTCSCGKEFVAVRSSLLAGTAPSCGCLKSELTTKRLTTHGDTLRSKTTTEYNSWSCMIQRCTNPRLPSFKDYGGRGITICDRWRSSFENFLEDMGRKPSPKHSIDRIDTNGNYEPSNCKWSTGEEQHRNQRSNRKLTYEGRTETVSEWARILGIQRVTLNARLERGWSVEKTFTTPFKKKFK